MEILRQNIFYVVLVAVVLVLCGALWFVNDSISETVDQYVGARDKVSNLLKQFAGGETVNAPTLEVGTADMKNWQLGVTKIVDRTVAWNSRNLLPQMISARVGDSNVRAFPADPNRYEVLAYKFSENYLDRFNGIVQSLAPIAPVTEEEINRAKDDMIAQKKARTATSTAPAGPQEDFAVIASDMLRGKRASEGMVYLDAGFTEKVITKPETSVSRKTLWEAQVHLWVLSDLVDAIRATNAQALRGDGSQIRQGTVVNSAVKRILKINIAKDYQVQRAGTTAADLTRRGCTKDYDVMRYSMVLAMPYRYLPLLERKLLEQNLHTILKVDVAEVPADSSVRYYYGPDPVVQVTLEGELLLLTAWERGTYTAATKTWKYPPLMPAEVLAELKKLGATMRTDDALPR